MDRSGNEDNPSMAGRRRAAPGTRHLDLATVSAYVDGALDQAEREAIEVHLASCAACRQEVAEISVTVDLLHDLPRYRSHRSFRLDPAVARRQRGNVVWLGRYLHALPLVRVATAAVALLFLGTIVADVLTEPEAPSQQDLPAEQGRAPAEREQIVMATATAALDAAASDEGPAQDEAMQGAGDTAADEIPAAAESGSQPRAAAVAPPTPTATAVPTATPSPPPTPVPERPASAAGDRLPWRVAEVGLGIALLLLTVVMIVLQRLRRRLVRL